MRFAAGDAIRAVAALSVVVFHVAFFADPGRAPFAHAYGSVLGPVLAHLDLGLYLFFVLSGYLIARPFVARFIDGRPMPAIRGYAAARVFRIVPAFWVVFTLLLIRHGSLGTNGSGIASVYLFAQNYHATTVSILVGPAWTLDVEVIFYALVPIGAMALLPLAGRGEPSWRARVVIVATLGVTALSLLARVLLPQDATWQVSTPAMLFAFAPGILCAALEQLAPPRLRSHPALARRWTRGLLAAGAVGALGYVIGPGTGADPARLGWAPVLAAASAACLVAAALVREWSGARPWRPFRSRALSWTGQRSYGLYLVHQGVLLDLLRWRVGAAHPVERFLALLPVTVILGLVLAAALFKWVEQPCIELGRRLGRRGAPSAVAARRGRIGPVGNWLPRPQLPYLWPILSVALIVRLLFAVLSHTNGDIQNMQRVATWLAQDPLHIYSREQHGPPAWPYLSGYFPLLWVARAIHDHLGISYAFVVRVPVIAANFAMAWLVDAELARRGAPIRSRLLTLAGLLFGPLLILESGWHAQLDIVATTFAVGGFVAWERLEGDSRAVTAAVLLAAAALIKTPAGFAVIALAANARSRREFVLLLAVTGGIVLGGAMPWLITEHHALFHQLGYVGVPGIAGLNLFQQPDLATVWLNGAHVQLDAAVISTSSHAHTVSLVAAGAAALFVCTVRPRPAGGAVIVFMAIYATAARASLQYLVWVLPFIALAGWTDGFAWLQVVLTIPTVLFYAPLIDGGFGSVSKTWPKWVTYVVYLPVMDLLWAASVATLVWLAVRAWRQRVPLPWIAGAG